MNRVIDRLERTALAPLAQTSKGYYLLLAVLLAIIGVGVYAYSTQLQRGLAVTGMAPTVNKIIWGVYISNFVFFIGISHAGTLISAILRVFKAGWRTPVTRMAEFITVVSLSVGALMVIIDMGRPDRVLNMITYGRWQSPILWDFLAITTYLTGSLIFLYLPLIPDMALCRDRLSRVVSPWRQDRLSSVVSPWRQLWFRLLSAGWVGAQYQRRKLTVALGMMMVLIIPVAVSVHTVISWLFGMTLRVGWNSSVYGAYFVAGAIFSGTATIIIVMAILRKVYRLEEYITNKHFINLGYMMAGLALIMMYFNLSEYLTSGYKMAGGALEAGELFFLNQIFTGAFAPIYWFYALGGLVVPGLIILFPQTRKLPGILTAAVLVTVAMWFERYIIVVATTRVPQMPYSTPADYLPTWVELAITAAAFALFALAIAIFAKLFPLVSVWEVREHLEEEEEAQRTVPAQVPGGLAPGTSIGD